MTPDPTAVQVRLSQAQMAVIWPGLDFLVRAFLAREATGGSVYAYPFQVQPLPPGTDAGTFSPRMMAQMQALWSRLQPKSKSGGRVTMNSFELRAAVLSARVQLGLWRRRAYDERRRDKETIRRWGFDANAIRERAIKTQRVIRSLERQMKRASRRSLRLTSPEVYAAMSKEWQGHLRWMRLHLAYFKPFQPLGPGRRRRQLQTIDRLVELAQNGIRSNGYVLPNPQRLRAAMRLFARYSRRGRIGFRLASVFRKGKNAEAEQLLVEFVGKRTRLVRSSSK